MTQKTNNMPEKDINHGVSFLIFLVIALCIIGMGIGFYYLVDKPLTEKNNLKYCGDKKITYDYVNKEKYNCCWSEDLIKENGAWSSKVKCEAKKHDT